MGKEFEELLIRTSSQLGHLLPLVEQNQKDLRELTTWKIQREQHNKDVNIEGRLAELEKKVGSSKNLPQPPAPRREGIPKRILIEAASMALVGFVAWLLTHLWTLSKMAKLLEQAGTPR